MDKYIIEINWEGPLSVETIIKKMNDGGSRSNNYSGKDYGLYQIYGYHILCRHNTLLYVGKATKQTFSQRFKQHQKEWLSKEKEIKVYLGRIVDAKKYTKAVSWEKNVDVAEAIMIYKYCPNYNGSGLGESRKLYRYTKVQLVHIGEKNRLEKIDRALED